MVLVALVAGYYYFSKTGEDYPGKEYVDKYTTTQEVEISESEDPSIIEKELESTELELDEFEKDLEGLESELDEL